MLKLVVTEKGGESKQLAFDKDEISIGRVQGNDIVLPKGNISKRHTKIALKEGRFLVLDQKSTNGTYVNGRKISDPTAVSGADKIYVGDFIITLDGSEGDGAAAAVRRPGTMPPPPPPPRGGGAPPPPKGAMPPRPAAKSALPDEDDEGDVLESAGASGPTAPARPVGRGAPPPPPPPRREVAPIDEDGLAADDDEGPPSPSDVEDEEEAALATAPPRRAAPPPLRPVPPVASDDDDDELDSVLTGGRPARAQAPVAAAAAPSAPVRATASASARVSPAAAARSGRLEDLLADDGVDAVYISGPDSVHAERGGRIESTAISLGDAATLADTIRNLAQKGTVLGSSEDGSLLDVRMPDGSRLAAILPPAAVSGACATIRKPIRQGRSLAALAGAGALSKEMQQLLEACIAGRRNLLVTGDAGAALVMTGALASAFRAESRVVSVGGNAEVSLPLAGWVDVSAGGGGVIRVAGAMRPDYLVVTAVGASDVPDVLHVGALGQEGIVCTLPARTAVEALCRMEALALQTPGAGGTRELIASTFDLVVHTALLADGSLRVVEVGDVKLVGEKLGSDPVLVWKADPVGSDGKAAGRFQATGATPRVAATLAARGAALPTTLFRKS